MGVLIEYHFSCDFCEVKEVVRRMDYSRYEVMWEPTSPSNANPMNPPWFWLDHKTVACDKHWNEIRQFIVEKKRLDA